MAKTIPNELSQSPKRTTDITHDMGKQQSQKRDVSAYITSNVGNSSLFWATKSPEEITQTTPGMNLQSSDLCVRSNNIEPTNQSMRKGSTHTIHKSAEENDMGKTKEIPAREK